MLSVNSLSDFLEKVDYLVATLPQTTSTDNLLDAAALAKLPAHAYFINVGRSNVVDDEALMDFAIQWLRFALYGERTMSL